MRIWRLSLTVAVAGLLVHIPARAIGGTDEGLISHGPVRQTGVVITTLQDEPGTRGAESPFSPPDGAGFAGAEDQEFHAAFAISRGPGTRQNRAASRASRFP